MILSDRTIKQHIDDGKIGITPYDEDNVEPASVDLRLGKGALLVECRSHNRTVDTRGADPLHYEPIYEYEDYIVIHPSQFVLTTTLEQIELPDDIAASVLGRSSLGRLGISVHQTAGFIDPGFEGQITLELSNHGPAPVMLHKGDAICQIIFSPLDRSAEKPYGHEGSKYQGQYGATPSKFGFT